MNRVTKRFLRKMAEPVGMMLYIALVFFSASVAEDKFGPNGYLVVIGVFLLLPSIFFMTRLTWQLANDEIERENDKLVRKIKGE